VGRAWLKASVRIGRPRARHVAALALVAALVPSTARAGNDEGVLIGNEAAITGGAVTAVTSDGAAIWYDPAGIAAVTRSQIDVSGSATQLRIADTPALLSSATTGRSADGGYFEVIGIPSAVALVRRIDHDIVLGFGIFTPSLTNHTDRVSLTDDVGGMMTRWQLVQQETSQSTYAGISLAHAITPTLRLGVTLFGLYRQTTLSTHFFGGTMDSGGDTIFASGSSSLSSLQSVGLELAVGFQWDIVPGLTLGVSARSPDLQLGSLFRSTSARVRAEAGGILFDPMDESGLAPNVQVITPTRLRAGLALRGSRGWLAIDVDVAHELSVESLGIERRWTFNARIGGRYFVDENFSIGGGIFTDTSPAYAVTTYGQTQVDFVGGALGLELHTPHTLGPGEPAPDLVFAQTFALRYAAGFGHIGGLRFEDAAGGTSRDFVASSGTTVHEISLHIGSALYF
jgi:hypothetical protein